MAVPWGRSRFVCWNITRVKSVVTVQRAFRAKYAKHPPTDKTIRAWYKQIYWNCVSVQAEIKWSSNYR